MRSVLLKIASTFRSFPTDQDLEKLGIVLGDRRNMLQAIANLDNAPPAAAPASAPTSMQQIAATIAVPAPESAGERRHVTVMFCDLVDSTGVAARLDAHRIPRANCCAPALSVVHEGHVHACARSLAISANLHGSPSARGDEMVSARCTPSASMVRCWCPRFDARPQ